MDIKILGTGCPRCKALEQATRNAAAELDISADIEKVEDIVKIMNYGVMHTPALIINDRIALSGRIPSSSELKEILVKFK